MKSPAPILPLAAGLVIRQPVGQTPERDLSTSTELLRGVASGAIRSDRVLRLYRPAPTLAMSRRESRMPGFDRASDAARRHGFTPAIRPTGGRAVAYDESCLVFDLVDRDTAAADPSEFFARSGNSIAGALRGLGVDARVHAVDGEYCPGPFSVNARGVVKLVGTSQRAVRGARLLSGMLALGRVDKLVAVLREANEALDLVWDPATFGSLLGEAPSVDRSAVEDALVTALIAD